MRGSTAGFSDTLDGDSWTRKTCYSVLDCVFSLVVVAPAVVGYWRSVWGLMEYYVFEEDSVISAAISTGIGYMGHLIFTFLQHPLERNFSPQQNRIVYVIVSRFYTFVFAFVCVNGWRGPWLLLDEYTSSQTVTATTAVGVIALVFMRTLRNVSAPPCAVMVDTYKDYFAVPTMFRVELAEKKILFYILDCLFSVFVVGTLVVFVWRGIWVLLDHFLFPDDEKSSAFGSLIIGYAFVAAAFLLQPVMRRICETLTGVSRILAADIYVLFSLFGTINAWRGIWNLLNLYFLPDDIKLSCWITHWVCLVLLVLLRCSNSLLVRGVYIDAEEPAGECVVFPCFYLRLLLHEHRLKKLKSKLKNMESKDVEKQEIDGIKPKVYMVEMNHTGEGEVEQNHKAST